MPKLSCCGLESFKTWRDNSIVGEGIPLDNCQGKEGKLIGILSSMDLSECHGIEPGWPISGLYIIGEGNSHEAIDNSIEEAETGH